MSCSSRRARAPLVAASAALAMLAAVLTGPTQAADTLVDLGTLPGGIYGFAGGIDADGQVAGGADTADGTIFRAFLWNPIGGMQDIGGLGGDAYATALNDGGVVVGYSALSQDRPGRFLDHAFRWTTGSLMQDLGTLAGGSISRAYGVNGLGQVVGESSTSEGGSLVFRAFLWTPGAGMASLGTLPLGGPSIAYGINDAGQIVGQADAESGNTRAFLWTPAGGMQDLGTLPGGTFATARGINNLGQVVGWSEVAGGARHAFVWDAVGGMRDLGTLPGGSESSAYGINAAGQVVGASFLADGATLHAVLWEPDGSVRDLGVLPGGSYSVAYGINAAGQVVGQSTNAAGYDHGVRWQLNRAPVADALALTTPQDTASAFVATASDPDGDALSWTLVTGPVNGTITGSLPSATYTPAPGYTGGDSFTFRVNDGLADSAVVTVSITVTPLGDPQTEVLDGRMKGAGYVDADGNRHGFEFRVRTAGAGAELHGHLEYRVGSRGPQGAEGGPARRGNRFVSTAVTAATFTDDPGITPGRRPQPIVDTVVFSGQGEWNGSPGYTFEVRAIDAGEPGPGRDRFAATITSPSGEVVSSVDGVLSAGNIQSKRLAP